MSNIQIENLNWLYTDNYIYYDPIINTLYVCNKTTNLPLCYIDLEYNVSYIYPFIKYTPKEVNDNMKILNKYLNTNLIYDRLE